VAALTGFATAGRLFFRNAEIRIPPAEDRQDCPDQWLHEIKYDGYRLRIERDGAAVR
jgi:ATP-dependent DNA ligase